MTDDELRLAIPALRAGGAAVITGAAGGIGLACAKRFAALGLPLVLADRDAARLAQAARDLPGAVSVAADLSKPDDIARLRDVALNAGAVSVLMNNAGASIPTKAAADPQSWRSLFDINFFSVVECTAAFAPAMIAQMAPGLIINTGSKQGITTPPGNPAYNASKSALKTYTEALDYELRNTPGCKISAHLLIPGYTFTGIAGGGEGEEKPAAAWTAGQVADFLMEALARQDFYILCPDNETTRTTDEKRMRWAMDDVIRNRPALSRWHPAHKDEFDRFMKS